MSPHAHATAASSTTSPSTHGQARTCSLPAPTASGPSIRCAADHDRLVPAPNFHLTHSGQVRASRPSFDALVACGARTVAPSAGRRAAGRACVTVSSTCHRSPTMLLAICGSRFNRMLLMMPLVFSFFLRLYRVAHYQMTYPLTDSAAPDLSEAQLRELLRLVRDTHPPPSSSSYTSSLSFPHLLPHQRISFALIPSTSQLSAVFLIPLFLASGSVHSCYHQVELEYLMDRSSDEVRLLHTLSTVVGHQLGGNAVPG